MASVASSTCLTARLRELAHIRRDFSRCDIAWLAPKEPPELKARTINRACTFLERHQSA
jgi:hypothetical protein